MTRWWVRGLLVLMLAPLWSCTTQFYGSAHFPGGARGCWDTCHRQGLEMSGFVYSGEFASSCVCRPADRATPGVAPPTGNGAASPAPAPAAGQGAPGAAAPAPAATDQDQAERDAADVAGSIAGVVAQQRRSSAEAGAAAKQ